MATLLLKKSGICFDYAKFLLLILFLFRLLLFDSHLEFISDPNAILFESLNFWKKFYNFTHVFHSKTCEIKLVCWGFSTHALPFQSFI